MQWKLIIFAFCIVIIAASSVGYGLRENNDASDGITAPRSMEFSGIAEPLSIEDKHQWHSTNSVVIDGNAHKINFHPLITTGQILGAHTFGLMMDKDGHPLKVGGGNICRSGSGPDYTSLLRFEDKLFAVSQLECAVGGAYVMTLNQQQDGLLAASALHAVDFSSVYGTYYGCAGVTTSWNSHLGSEERAPPMGLLQADGRFPPSHARLDKLIKAIADYNKIEVNKNTAKHIGYYMGWIPETKIISSNGDTTVEKHYAMGRFFHELAYVMPDNKTVYLSDDGVRAGLFMFIADKPEKLSAGVLYAAKWVQQSKEGAGRAAIEWISLGHATNAEISAKLEDPDYGFDNMWIKTQPLPGGKCPRKFKSVNAGKEGRMCLQLVQGEAKYASRLETRLYAAYLGATTEFNKEEGITYNVDDNKLYIAMSRIGRAMTDAHFKYDFGGHNDIALAKNGCGAVYALDVVPNKKDMQSNDINSNYVAANMYPELQGHPAPQSPSQSQISGCDVDTITNPDNISYLPGFGVLLIAEDGNINDVDKIWAYNVRDKTLTRIFSGPFGSEVTSSYWHANINGFGYATVVIQHPYADIKRQEVDIPADPARMESIVGYIGPFPPLSE